MGTHALRLSAISLTFALFATPVVAFADPGTPAREANIWGWRDHQPTESQVRQNERAAGIAPTPSQGDADAAAVDQLYRQLLHHTPGHYID